MYGFAQTLNGKHAGRRLSDAVGEKLEYYSLIRIVCHREPTAYCGTPCPYKTKEGQKWSELPSINAHDLWVVWRKGRREGRSLGEIRVGSNPTVPTSPTTLQGVQNSGDGLPFKGLLVPPSLTSRLCCPQVVENVRGPVSENNGEIIGATKPTR